MTEALKLQQDVALVAMGRKMARLQRETSQIIVVLFISDHDPSGLDLQRAWEEALLDGVGAVFVRIGLTQEQITDPALDIERLAIEVKETDSRSRSYGTTHGSRPAVASPDAGRSTCCPRPPSSRRLRPRFAGGSIWVCGAGAVPRSRAPASCSDLVELSESCAGLSGITRT
jgi:hypothetical protein